MIIQINDDNLTVEALESLLEGMKDSLKRKEILSQHKSPVKQLPSGKWYTRVNGRKMERKNKADLEDAIIEAYKQSELTLEFIFDDYIERRKMDVADTTCQKDIRYFNMFLKGSDIAVKPLKSLNLDDGYQFLRYCLEIKPDMKRKYWNNLLGFLNQMFQYAMDKRIITSNPFKNLKPKKDLFAPPTKTRDGDTVFTRTERTKVCALAEEDARKKQKAEPLGIILLFNLGIRCGELCAIKWSDIETNCRGQYIHIQREMVVNVDDKGKANGFRILPHCKTPAGDRRLLLNDKAIELLQQIEEYNKLREIPTSLNDYIFLRKYKKQFINCTPRSFEPRLRRYCREAGMSVIKSPHDVRRTVLTNLYEAHMPLKKIQEFAGHSSLKQTMDYIRISDEDIDMMQYLNTLSETDENNTVIPFKKQA